MESTSSLHSIELVLEILIDVYYSLDKKSLLMIKVAKLNQIVLRSDMHSSLDEKATEALKGVAIVTAVLTFYEMDFNEMKLSISKARDSLSDFIYYFIEHCGMNKQENVKSKLKLFMKSTKQQDSTSKRIILLLIKGLFGMKSHYRCIQLQLTQLLDSIAKLTLLQISDLISSSLLFNYNHSKVKANPHTQPIPRAELLPAPPFIKTPSVKEYTLVLDMDETLTHNLILPFGNYFIARPLLIPFLKEMSQCFELVIFTASAQSYADNIIDQLNQQGVISHRLYKNHSSTFRNKTLKDLGKIGRPIEKILLVDNIKDNARGFYDNFLPILTWQFDLFDNELTALAATLKSILVFDKEDLRNGVKALSTGLLVN